MAKNKTVQNDANVDKFLNDVDNTRRREDAWAVKALIEDTTGMQPAMWGTSIVGYGSYHYVYESGREGDMPLVGFSPRKQNLTLYIMDGFEGYQDLLQDLGPHSTGVSCLYIKKLDDIDQKILKTLIQQSVEHIESNFDETTRTPKTTAA